MSVEEIDFAIYGSDIDAAFLAAELVREHGAKVLLIRDQVNDYSIHHLQTYSVGAFCEPDTLRIIGHGLERWHSKFSGRTGRDCFERTGLALRVGNQHNKDLLHYVEGAMIAIDQQFERKADTDGIEHLKFRGVVAPSRKKALEFIYNKYVGSGLAVFDRTNFESATRQKSGPLVLRSSKMRYDVGHSIFLDVDLVQSQSTANKNNVLRTFFGSKIVVKSHDTRPVHTINLDSEFETRPHGHGQLLVKSHGSFNDLAHQAERTIHGFLDKSLIAQGTYQDVATKDGSPMFAKLNTHQSVFAGGKNASAFLMPSVADILVGSQNAASKDYWQHRASKNRQCADILQAPKTGGEFQNAGL
ncbi:hypothetical protein [Maritalea sp.]|uniref:hypothetical protein n=1 Tax=Maritalea sp. TaxID=2003361 RepID=UPI003EF4667E